MLLGIYLAFKIGDVLIRETYRYLGDGSVQSTMFIVEMLFGVIVPIVMLLFERIRTSKQWLFTASLMIVLGVALNRVNVFLVAYQPPYAVKSYFPSLAEFAVTIGLVSALILIYRLIVMYFPVITHEPRAKTA